MTVEPLLCSSDSIVSICYYYVLCKLLSEHWCIMKWWIMICYAIVGIIDDIIIDIVCIVIVLVVLYYYCYCIIDDVYHCYCIGKQYVLLINGNIICCDCVLLLWYCYYCVETIEYDDGDDVTQYHWGIVIVYCALSVSIVMGHWYCDIIIALFRDT